MNETGLSTEERKSLDRALAQSAAGETVYLGDFSQYAEQGDPFTCSDLGHANDECDGQDH